MPSFHKCSLTDEWTPAKKIKENNKSMFFNQSPKLHVINKNSMTSTKILKNIFQKHIK